MEKKVKRRMSEKVSPAVSSTRSSTQPRADFGLVFSLIGGLLITFDSLVGVSYAMMGRPYFWGMGGMMSGYSNFMGGMIGGYYGNNYYSSGFYGMMTRFELLGLISGLLILAFAILMKSRPVDRKTFGILVLAFPLVSLIGTGGFLIGSILGIIGGVLALSSA
jgi:Family of unknown function (DUF6114)